MRRVVATAPGADPPIVATLVRPLLQLRASLGTGRAVPSETVTTALSTASSRAAGTEDPHRQGMHALESTWAGQGADNTVPALRTTQTQIGDISDRGPAYLAVLADAHATSARAAQRVDQIIADFRRDARTILGNATAAPDTDAVITRATQALRDAITTVTTAQTEMNDHTQRLTAMGPLTVTDYSSPGTTPPATTPTQYGSGTGQYQFDQGTGTSPQGAYSPGTTYTPGGASSPGTYAAGVVPPQLDPVAAAQLQLQEQLIGAGVQVGTAAINAGVTIGQDLIDKIAEVGTHAMDTVASSADKAIEQAIPELLHPGSTTGAAGTGTGTSNGSNVLDFGGNKQSGSSPSSNSPSSTGSPGVVIPPAASTPNAAPAPPPATPPTPPASPPPAAVNPPPAPANPQPPDPGPDVAAQPDPKAGQSAPGGTAGGMALPPPPGTDGQDRKPPRIDGQLGVTVPAAEPMVPAAVIGDFGDDTI